MTVCGLPLCALSGSVLLGWFFVFLVFFGFVVCESVVCALASFEELDSARASEDPATDRAKAAMNERIRFEDTGRLLEGLRRGTFDPRLTRCSDTSSHSYALVWHRRTASTRHDSCSLDRDRRPSPVQAVGLVAHAAGSGHERGWPDRTCTGVDPSSVRRPHRRSPRKPSSIDAALPEHSSQAARLEASAPLRGGGCRPGRGVAGLEVGPRRREERHGTLAIPPWPFPSATPQPSNGPGPPP